MTGEASPRQEPEVLSAHLKEDARAFALSVFEAGFKACESGLNFDYARSYFVRAILERRS